MRLFGLRLVNYRKYRDASVEFVDGLMGIVGKNGAGKTTLIEAIAWCLYGKRASRSAHGEIMTTGAARGTTCSVTLDVEIDNEAFKIVRELKAGQPAGTAKIYSQNKSGALVTGAKEVTDYMSSRLRMDHVAFFTSIFAKQKELTALSDLAPSQRQKIISRLLRIDTVDSAIQMIKNDKKSLGDRIDGHREGAGDMGEIKKEVLSLKNTLRTKQLDCKIATKNTAATKNALTKAKHDLKKQEKIKDVYNKHKAALESALSLYSSKVSDREMLQTELADLENDRDRLDSLRQSLADYARIKANVDKLDGDASKYAEKMACKANVDDAKASIDTQIRELDERKSLMEDLESSLPDSDGLASDLAAFDERLAAARDAKSTARAKADDLHRRIEDKKKTVSRLKKLREDGTCPTCNRPLGDDFVEIVQSLDEEISELADIADAHKGSADRASHDMTDLEAEIDRAKAAVKEAAETKNEIDRLQSLIEDGERRMGEHRSEINMREKSLAQYSQLTYDEEEHRRLKERRDRLEETHDEATLLEGRTKSIPSTAAKIVKLDKEIRSLEEAIRLGKQAVSDSGFDVSEYSAVKLRHDKSDDIDRAARETLISLQGDVKAAKADLKHAEKTMFDEVERAKRIVEMEKEVAILARLEKIMADFKSNLIARIRPSLAARTSDLLRRMTGGKYSAVDLDGDYNIKIESDGKMFGIDRFSGGEQDLASLCLRIAISQELAERAGSEGPSFIVLDEVFGSQDGERKSAILEALSEISHEFRQIVLITHIEDIKDALPYVLHVREGPDGSPAIFVEGRPGGVTP